MMGTQLTSQESIEKKCLLANIFSIKSNDRLYNLLHIKAMSKTQFISAQL